MVSKFTISTSHAQILQLLPNSRRCELFLDHAFNLWKLKNPYSNNLGPQCRNELGGTVKNYAQNVHPTSDLLVAHDSRKNKYIPVLLKNVDFIISLVCNIYYFGIPDTVHENDPSQKINGYKVKIGGHELYDKAIIFVIFQRMFCEWQGIKYHIPSIGETKIIIIVEGRWLFNKTLSVLNYMCQWMGLFYSSSRLITSQSSNEKNISHNL